MKVDGSMCSRITQTDSYDQPVLRRRLHVCVRRWRSKETLWQICVPDYRLPDRGLRHIHTTSHATTGPPVSLLGLRVGGAEGPVVMLVGVASRVACPQVGEASRVGGVVEQTVPHSSRTACEHESCSQHRHASSDLSAGLVARVRLQMGRVTTGWMAVTLASAFRG